jgi:hypothetical protein
MEKIRKVSLSGSEIFESLVVILGINFICFLNIYVFEENLCLQMPKNKGNIKIVINKMLNN